jgi:hypothetical protein
MCVRGPKLWPDWQGGSKASLRRTRVNRRGFLKTAAEACQETGGRVQTERMKNEL